MKDDFKRLRRIARTFVTILPVQQLTVRIPLRVRLIEIQNSSLRRPPSHTGTPTR